MKRWKEGDRVWRRQQRRRSGACVAWESPVFVVCYRLVRLRKAQGHRPEGFKELCFFLCGGSASSAASTAPCAPAWCPLRLQLHPWLQVMKGPSLQKEDQNPTKPFPFSSLAQMLIFHFPSPSTSCVHYKLQAQQWAHSIRLRHSGHTEQDMI